MLHHEADGRSIYANFGNTCYEFNELASEAGFQLLDRCAKFVITDDALQECCSCGGTVLPLRPSSLGFVTCTSSL